MDVEIKLFFYFIYLFSLGIVIVKDTEINDSALPYLQVPYSLIDMHEECVGTINSATKQHGYSQEEYLTEKSSYFPYE